MAGYRWARIDLQLLSNPKLLGLSAEDALLFVAMVLWSAAELTDGDVPDRALPYLGTLAKCSPRASRVSERCQRLASAGLLSRRDCSWLITGYLDHQHEATRAVVEHSRQSANERKRRQRSAAANGHRDDTTRHDTYDTHTQHWSPTEPNGHGVTPPPSVTDQLRASGWAGFAATEGDDE